jgi:hypothetical protein
VGWPQSPPQRRSTSHGILKCSGFLHNSQHHILLTAPCLRPGHANTALVRQHRLHEICLVVQHMIIVISSDDEDTRPGSSSRSTIKPRMVKKPRHLVDNYKFKQVRLSLLEFQFRTDSRPLDQRAPRGAGRSPTRRTSKFEQAARGARTRACRSEFENR